MRTMHRANSGSFSDSRVVQLFDRYATYNGSSPYMTPATFNLIQHVEYGIGGYAVKGGIFEITKKLAALSVELGVNFHYGEKVGSIETEGSRVRGITVEGRELAYDVVVSNSDVTSTYRELLGGGVMDIGAKYASLEPSSSGGVFYWGIREDHRELLVNNIFFSSDYEREFEDIWDLKRPPSDPTIYVNITSKIDPEDSPPGGENWFVLVNVPYDSGQDWDREMTGLRERTIEKLERTIGRDIHGSIEVEGTLDPPGIESRWSGNKGSIYGISSNDRRSAFRRQGNRSRKIRGLYFCGGSAHPGGGMPLVVLSGKIASDLIGKYERSRS
jgi:phytoene desaturase